MKPRAADGNRDQRALPPQVLDVARHVGAGRSLEESDELLTNRGCHHRPRLNRGSPSPASLKVTHVSLGQAGALGDTVLGQAGVPPGVAKCDPQAHSDVAGPDAS